MDVTCDRSNIFHESLVARAYASARALPSDDLISADCPHLNPGYINKQETPVWE